MGTGVVYANRLADQLGGGHLRELLVAAYLGGYTAQQCLAWASKQHVEHDLLFGIEQGVDVALPRALVQNVAERCVLGCQVKSTVEQAQFFIADSLQRFGSIIPCVVGDPPLAYPKRSVHRDQWRALLTREFPQRREMVFRAAIDYVYVPPELRQGYHYQCLKRWLRDLDRFPPGHFLPVRWPKWMAIAQQDAFLASAPW